MQFRTAEEIIFGEGTIKDLEKKVNGAVSVITGPNIWQKIKKKIELESETIIFQRSNGEPEEGDVEKLAEELRERKPDTIVAIGGGSVIDAAKIARIIYEHGSSWDEMYSGKILPMKTRFIAVESTSGTGTGVSAAAVVKNDENYKAGIVSPYIIPDVAIYDPQVTISMPRHVAAYTGMDALTHTIEAYTSNIENLISDTLALKAIELINEHLIDSVKGNKDARRNVHYGNMLAGIGFTNSRLGLCHAAAHWIGGLYNIEHGKINAILLPYVVRVNERFTNKFKDVARAMDVKDVALRVMELNKNLGIPTKINFEIDIDSLSEKIANERLMNFNPVKLSVDEVRRFLIAVMEGDLDAI